MSTIPWLNEKAWSIDVFNMPFRYLEVIKRYACSLMQLEGQLPE